MRTAGRLTDAERKKVEEDASKSIKALLLISRADKSRFRKLKDKLANIYLLGLDQYPDTLKKAMQILGNYQITKYKNRSTRGDANKSGLAFIQQGGRGTSRGGCSKKACKQRGALYKHHQGKNTRGDSNFALQSDHQVS